MEYLSDLKDFIDLGGIFILALVLVYVIGRKLDAIETTLAKVLTLLVVITQRVANFNHLEDVLAGDKKKAGRILDDVVNGRK